MEGYTMEQVTKLLQFLQGFNLSEIIVLAIVFLAFWFFQKSESFNEFCRHEIQDIDDDRREELMHMTQEVVAQLARNSISTSIKCAMTRKALADAILSPLVESVNSNHFTKRLLPEHYSSFRQGLLRRMESSYSSIRQAYVDFDCEQSPVPEWKESKQICEYILAYWLSELCLSVSHSCERKLATYEKYLPHFRFSIHYKAITKDRIKRNKNYIKELNELHSKLKQELK